MGASPFDKLPSGTAVLVKGLKGAPEHNGKRGTVQQWNGSKGRYVVDLGGAALSLKQENLQQRVKQCEVLGIQSKPELNGQMGSVEDFDADKGRCHFKFDRGGKTASLSAANIILPPETRVRVDGLQSAPQHNGTWGQVVSYDCALVGMRSKYEGTSTSS